MIPKLRVWDTVKKAMHDVQAIVYTEERVYPIYSKLIRKYIPFGEAILMQYTGLKDKNGVEIFEGDVVEYIDGEFSFIGKVIKSQLGTYVTGSDNHSFEDFTDETTMVSDISVLGNIYENPNLLESVEE